MKAKHFFNHLQHDQIVAAIREAEKKTSGQIRVFVSRHQPEDVMAAARHQFDRLGMHQTRDRNAVLIFVAPRVRKFAVVGDSGVHARCGDAFWTKLAGEMTGRFKEEKFTEGIRHGIKQAGELLAEHFPHRPGDRNEQPDEIAEG